MARIDEAEAARTLEVLSLLGEAQAEIEAMVNGRLDTHDGAI
jgi:hypothetical protein